MYIFQWFKRSFAPAAFLGAFLVSGSIASASTSYDLSCVLNGLNGSTCPSGSSFGTITISDNGLNQVGVAVDLLNPALKFRDLMLNFDGGLSGITGITSLDGQVSLNPNGFSIEPYAGLFDVGSTGQLGWNGDSGYSTVLSGIGGVLTASQFQFTDTLGNVFVALHIQSIGVQGCSGAGDGSTNCLPGVEGNGSLKVGGVLDGGIPPSEVPEPSSFALVGIGLLAAGWVRLRQTRAASVR